MVDRPVVPAELTGVNQQPDCRRRKCLALRGHREHRSAGDLTGLAGFADTETSTVDDAVILHHGDGKAGDLPPRQAGLNVAVKAVERARFVG